METKLGMFGTVATGVSGLITWAVKHDAELRAAWIMISVGIAVLTLAWWVWNWVGRLWRWWKAFKKDERAGNH